MSRSDKKIPKNYKIRPDICKELEGMVALLNRDVPETEKVTETFVVESAITYFVQRFKNRISDFKS